MTNLAQWMGRAKSFCAEAHGILSVHETSASRVVLLEKTYRDLSALSLRQDELYRQSLRCVENGLYRAAHVMAWAGFMDFLEGKLCEDNLAALRAARQAWTVSTVEELREGYPEYQIIEALRAVQLCSKTEMKALHGLLNKRNECAHPSEYYPDLNSSLGYISEIIGRTKSLQGRALPSVSAGAPAAT
jgi:hypothetical protein